MLKAYQLFFTKTQQILSSIVGLSFLAYIIGWYRLQAYYDAIGADWLVNQITSIDILDASFLPILALAMGIANAIFDVIDLENNRKAIDRIFNFVIASAVILSVLAFYFSMTKDYEKAVGIKTTTIFLTSSAIGIVLGDIVYGIHKAVPKYSLNMAFVLSILIIMFFANLWSMAINKAIIDKTPGTTKLNIIETKDEKDLHLLYTNGDIFYAVKLDTNQEPKFKIIQQEDVISIFKKEIVKKP